MLVGVGAVFGFEALAQKSTAEGECDKTFCTQAGLDAIGAMHTSEAISTIGIGVGLVAIGTGAYFIVTGAPRHSQEGTAPATSLRVGPDLAARGVRLSLSW